MGGGAHMRKAVDCFSGIKLCVLAAFACIALCVGPLVSQAWAVTYSFASDESVYLLDADTGQTLYEQNADERVYPASTTKLMTVLVALDYIDESELDQTVSIGDEVDLTPANSSMAYLSSGDSYTWRDLFYGLLLPSGNDAAIVVATHVARLETGDESLSASDAVAEFVRLMNEKAVQLGCTGSHFVNPHGIHDDNHYTTARDMVTIARQVLQNDFIRSVVKTTHYSCTSGNGSVLEWYNTNLLLQQTMQGIYDGDVYGEGNGSLACPYYDELCTGVKTGSTDEAGKCLVFSGSNGSISVLGVVMHSANQATLYPEVSAALDGTLSDCEHHTWSDGTSTVADAKLVHASVGTLLSGGPDLVVKTDGVVSSTIDTTKQYETQVNWNTDKVSQEGDAYQLVTSSISAGEQVATLDVLLEGQVVASYPLYATRTVVAFGKIDLVVIALAITALACIVVAFIMHRSTRKKQHQPHARHARS
jgi:D-alanyl-D-alanine carboxypeptidase (penicillin-binding protein 5/6)